MTTLPNLGCVGHMVKACTVLRLHRLVISYLLSYGFLVVFSGVVAQLLYFEPACAA